MLMRSSTFASTIILTFLVGCSGSQQGSVPTKRVPSGIEKFRSTASAPPPAQVLAWFAGSSGDSAAALRTLTELLRHPDPEIRADAAYLLGYLGDVAARSALARALSDSALQVRFAACSALTWIKPGDGVEPLLLKLCTLDPSTKIRVAAAEALGRADETAFEAFRLGLADRDESLRERCEAALERSNKLSLPLPEQVYQLVSRQQYEQWKEARRVERWAIKNRTVYFEVVERTGIRPPPGAICAIAAVRHWYRAKLE
jgi:hypothetical protein